MRLYLDIDGVLTCDPVRYDFVETEIVNGAYLDWNKLAVRTLIDAYDEVVWATTWALTDGLDEVEQRLNIAPLPRVPLTIQNYERVDGITCGKLEAVRQHWEADPAPFMWIDDHLGVVDFEWAQRVGGKCLATDYEWGGVYNVMRLAMGEQ